MLRCEHSMPRGLCVVSDCPHYDGRGPIASDKPSRYVNRVSVRELRKRHLGEPIYRIAELVCAKFGSPVEVVYNKDKTRSASRVRQMVWWLALELPIGPSLSEVAYATGYHRDTVMQGRGRCAIQMLRHDSYKEIAEQILRQVRAGRLEQE